MRIALKELAAQGEIRGYEYVDLPGRDFLMTLSDGRIAPLEVKSLETGRRKHNGRYPHIPMVVTNHNRGNAFRRDPNKIKETAERKAVGRIKRDIKKEIAMFDEHFTED